MAYFVDPRTGLTTTDPRVHGFLWIATGDPELTELLTIWQNWLKTTLAINGMVMLSYTDILTLYSEIMLVSQAAAERPFIPEPPGPVAAIRGLRSAIFEDKPQVMNRAQGAKYLSLRQRSFTSEQTTACTLQLADLVVRQSTWIPEWQLITYNQAATTGGGQVVGWVCFYDPMAIRDGSVASGALENVRAQAVRVFMIPPNIAPPRPPPLVQMGPLAQVQQQLADAALHAHVMAPHPDSIAAQDVKERVLTLMSMNQFQSTPQLRVDHPEGPARQNACAEEIGTMSAGINGTNSAMKQRIYSVISAATGHLESNPLLEFLGKGNTSIGQLLDALKDMAQNLLTLDQQKDVFLFTVQGIRALNNALHSHTAFFEHIRSSAASAGGSQPSIAEMLELLTKRCSDAASHGGPIVASDGAHHAQGQTPRATHASQAVLAAAALKQNAQVLIWAVEILADPNTRSIDLHRALFICANAAHPDWISSGLLHALAFGNINATLIDHKLCLVYEYSTDHYIGIYLCHMLVASAVRAKLLTEAQAKQLVGFSLTALAKSVRSNDWAPMDIVNDADLAIRAELNRQRLLPPPQGPRHRTPSPTSPR